MEQRRKRPEILAPAGSMEAMRAAVYAGADAVYAGGNRFGARAYADNFDDKALIAAIEYCHIYGVKVYLTINTLFRNEEIKELIAYLKPLYEAGLDAVIVQDLGVMDYVHRHFPDMPIHASTQMTITTKYAYSLLGKYGVTRIVPARELSLEEIVELKENGKPELEVFVQGALCYCYSGTCLMSSMLGGRSGNRGRCAQPCRLPYELYENEDAVASEGPYLLSPKDLCGLESVEALIGAGVDSFKIEGRMKQPEYVAVCVEAYRAVVDACFTNTLTEDLIAYHKKRMAEVFNRGGFTKGYYRQHNGKNMMSMEYPGNAGVRIGELVAVSKNQITGLLSVPIYKGDMIRLENQEGELLLTSNVEAAAGEKITLNIPKTCKAHKGQGMIRIWHSPLMQQLSDYVVKERPLAVRGKTSFITGRNAKLTLCAVIAGEEISVVAKGELVEAAKANPVSKELVEQKLKQTGNTRYYFDAFDSEVSENAFYSMKLLKDLRRSAFALLEEAIVSKSRREFHADTLQEALSIASLQHMEQADTEDAHGRTVAADTEGVRGRTAVAVSSREQYEEVLKWDKAEEIYIEMQYFSLPELIDVLDTLKNKKVKLPHYVILPPIMRKKELGELQHLLKQVSDLQLSMEGLVVRNVDEFAYLHSIAYQGKIITDMGLYAMNDYGIGVIREAFLEAVITLPAELNRAQLIGLTDNVSNVQLVGYGYQQLMVSAGCLYENTKGCNQGSQWLTLKDRYKKDFYVKCICKYCYNLIYNGVPTVLFDLLEKDMEGYSTRIHFTREGKEEVLEVLASFEQAKAPDMEFTRGHYRRGVE